jgi:hypothetical protein
MTIGFKWPVFPEDGDGRNFVNHFPAIKECSELDLVCSL